MDILIMNMNEPPSLLRNDLSGSGHWLKVLLTGVESNRSAIGALVVARYGERTQAQTVMAQSSYLSVNDRRLHFGLGTETHASLEIRWPNGKSERIANLAAGQLSVALLLDSLRSHFRGLSGIPTPAILPTTGF